MSCLENRRKRLAAAHLTLAAAVGVWMSGTPAWAMDKQWIDPHPNQGFWNSDARWDPSGQPQHGDRAFATYVSTSSSDDPTRTITYFNPEHQNAVLELVRLEGWGQGIGTTGTMILYHAAGFTLRVSTLEVGFSSPSLRSFRSGGQGVYDQIGGVSESSVFYLGRGVGSSGTYVLRSLLTSSGVPTNPSHSGNVIYVGVDGTGTVNQSTGDVTAGVIFVGTNPGSTGTYNLSGTTWEFAETRIGATLTLGGLAGSLIVGERGAGTFTLRGTNHLDYPVVLTSRSASIARFDGSTGTVSLSDWGTWNNSGNLYVGGRAGNPGGTGLLQVGRDAPPAFLDVGGTLFVWPDGHVDHARGDITTAVLDIRGGSVNKEPNARLAISTDLALWGSFDIGLGSGSGTLSITAGGSLTSGGSAVLGRHADSTGTAIISGSDATGNPSRWIEPDGWDLWVLVGHSGTGSLSITDGGNVDNTNGIIAANPGASGAVTIAGPGSAWNSAGSVYVGGQEGSPGGSGTVTVADGGTLNVGNTLLVWDDGVVNYVGGTTIAPMIDLRGGGRVLLSAGGDKTLITDELAIDAAGGSFLDLADNELTVHDTPLAQVHAYVASGYAGGSWTGSGIVSSAAGAEAGRALGVSPDGSQVKVKFTWFGDATLDEAVTIADLGILAANWQGTGKFWFEGDFNYDGSVTIADLGILAANWQKGIQGGSAGLSFQEAMAMFDVFEGVVVPEPAVVSLLALAGVVACRGRRTRKHCHSIGN